MPTEENILGFSNHWYKDGFKHIVKYRLDGHNEVNIFSSPYFIASKLEAFKGRGNNDGRTSPDFEDIVFVIDNRKLIWYEMRDTKGALRQYLIGEWIKLLNNPYHEEWIAAHLDHKTAPVRMRSIIASMNDFVSNTTSRL